MATNSISDLTNTDSELLEDYPDGPEGHTKLLLGHTTSGRPVHIVINVAQFEDDFREPLAVVTVYEPSAPEWVDERTRRPRR